MLNPYLFAIDSDWLWHWGPVIFFGSLGLWLCWPKEFVRSLWPSRAPLQAAAERAYEAAKTAGALNPRLASQSPEAILCQFKKEILVDEGTQVFGIRPPSKVPELISKAELIDDLYPVDGNQSHLEAVIPDGPVYVDVTVRSADLKRFIKDYIANERSSEGHHG